MVSPFLDGVCFLLGDKRILYYIIHFLAVNIPPPRPIASLWQLAFEIRVPSWGKGKINPNQHSQFSQT